MRLVLSWIARRRLSKFNLDYAIVENQLDETNWFSAEDSLILYVLNVMEDQVNHLKLTQLDCQT